MPDKFFYINATETVTIKGNQKELQIVHGAEIVPLENSIIIKDFKLKNKDIYSVKVEVGDIVEHTNKAGVTEIYEVKSVSYKKSKVSFPNKINLKVENIKNKPINSNTYNISGINGSNISIKSPHSNQIINIKDEIEKDPEIEEKLKELEDAIQKKDKNKFQYVLGTLMDKGFDVGIGLLLAKLTSQIK